MPAPSFEFFVANRYLRARRKEAVISVITVISVIGVAAGVMALVIALAVNNGFRNTLQRNLLGATAHINIEERKARRASSDWRELAEQVCASMPHVVAVAPALYAGASAGGTAQSTGVELKGIDIDAELAISEPLRHLKAGSLDGCAIRTASLPGIILGERLARRSRHDSELSA